MKTMTMSLIGIAFTAASALALDQPLIDNLMTSAQNIERDANAMHDTLRNKNAGSADISAKLDAIGGDVTKMHELVSQFEATSPNLSQRDREDWNLLKEKVKLIEIFHGQKSKLAADNLDRNRGLIRAHAKGVALRAAKLQQTAAKLRRGA